MCLGVAALVFIQLGVCWVSWICRLFFTKFGKFMTIFPSINFFPLGFLSFLGLQLHIRQLNVVLQSAFQTEWSLWLVLDFKDPFFYSTQSAANKLIGELSTPDLLQSLVLQAPAASVKPWTLTSCLFSGALLGRWLLWRGWEIVPWPRTGQNSPTHPNGED